MLLILCVPSVQSVVHGRLFSLEPPSVLVVVVVIDSLHFATRTGTDKHGLVVDQVAIKPLGALSVPQYRALHFDS